MTKASLVLPAKDQSQPTYTTVICDWSLCVYMRVCVDALVCVRVRVRVIGLTSGRANLGH